jgi:hypothetical protein
VSVAVHHGTCDTETSGLDAMMWRQKFVDRIFETIE